MGTLLRNGNGVLQWAYLFVWPKSVCLYASISQKPHFRTVHVASGRVSTLFWWRCNTLCTSGFVNDVIFSNSGPYSTCDAIGCKLEALKWLARWLHKFITLTYTQTDSPGDSIRLGWSLMSAIAVLITELCFMWTFISWNILMYVRQHAHVQGGTKTYKVLHRPMITSERQIALTSKLTRSPGVARMADCTAPVIKLTLTLT